MSQEVSQTKISIQSELEDLFSELEKIEKSISSQKSDPVRISDKLREGIAQICKKWNNEISASIIAIVSAEYFNSMDNLFLPLKELSLARTSHIRKATLVNAIEMVLTMSEQILFDVVYRRPIQERNDLFSPLISKLVQSKISETLSLLLLKEANDCFSHSKRASIMLSWSATIAFLHDAIELNGYNEFNSVTHQAAQKKGRFERLNSYKNQPPQISSLAQLIQFNEGHLLLVLEEMGFYREDGSKSLDFCFTLRNQAAHPTNFIPTEGSLKLYCSVLEEYIFGNTNITKIFQRDNHQNPSQ